MTKAEMTTVSGDVNAWSKSCTGVGSHRENWKTDIQEGLQHLSSNFPPQQFDSWHGAPVCPSDGLLHEGDPLVGPFRPLEISGCYPVEASSYYPQVPAQFGNPQVVAKLGNAPSDCYANTEDMFFPCPQSDAFRGSNVPVMPARPGMHLGPATFDAYYGPRPSFCSFNDSHGPGRGTAAASSVYNQHNASTVKFSSCSGWHTSGVAKEIVKSDQINAPCQGYFKVLLKQHHGSEDNYACEKQEQFSRDSRTILVEDQREVNNKDVEWETEGRKDEKTTSNKSLPGKGPSQRPCNRRGKSTECGSPKISSSSKIDNNVTTRQTETDTHLIHDQQRYPATKNTALIEKIEVLNNKARMVDSHGETEPVILQQKSIHSKAVAEADVPLPLSSPDDAVNGNPASVALGFSLSRETGALPEESDQGLLASNKLDLCEEGRKNHSHVKIDPSMPVKKIDPSMPFKKIDPSMPRSDHCFIKNFDGVEDELKYRTSARNLHIVGTIRYGECGSSGSMIDSGSSIERNEEFLHTSNSSASGQFVASSMDLTDRQAQRAKFKERAVKRGEQLRQEEEGRAREQKARALAKLEELDRRTVAQCQNQESSSNPSVGSNYQLKDDSETSSALGMEAILVKTPFDNSTGTYLAAEPPGCDDTKSLGERSYLSNSDGDGLAVLHDQSLPLNQDAGCIEENIMQIDSLDIHDINLVNNEQIGYRRRPIIAPEEKLVECSINSNNLGNPKKSDKEILHLVAGDTTAPMEDLLIENKKKSVKNVRNKKKFNQGTQGRNLPSERLSEANLGVGPNVMGNPLSELADPISLTAQACHEPDIGKILSNDGDASSMKRSANANNEQHGRVSNQWKPQSSKRSARNQQTKGNEAVVWAPVKPQCKNNTFEEVIHIKTETSRSYSGNSGQTQNCGTKIKRAEMERYIPKSVAREISRAENSPHASATMNQASASDVTGEADILNSGSGMSSGIPVVSAEMQSVDKYKTNRHGKIRASWRQRNPLGSNQQDLHISGEVDTTYETVDSVERPSDQHKELKSKPMEQFKQDSSKDDIENPEPSELGAVSFCKDQGVASKHRHQRYKVQRGSVDVGAHLALKDLRSRSGYKNDSDPASEVSESGGRGFLGVDDRNAGNSEHNRRAHWQPKLQAHAYDVQGGNKGRSIAPESKKSILDISARRSPQDFIHGNQDTDLLIQGIRGSYVKTASTQEGNNRERSDLIVAVQKQTQFPNEFNEVELALSRVDPYHRCQHGSTMWRHGRSNVWLNKSQESTYGGWDEGQDTGTENLHSGGNNKRKNGSHFEYQPIGSHNNKPCESQPKCVSDVDVPGGVIRGGLHSGSSRSRIIRDAVIMQ